MTDPRELLRPFIEQARWFGGKGREFTITGGRRLGEVPGRAEEWPRVTIDLVRLTYADTGEEEYYQLPLAFYPEPQGRLEHALVDVWDDPDFGTCHVYDAVHDRDAMACFLRSFDARPEGELAFRRLPGHQLDLEARATLFGGEQSNSSVVFGEDCLLKVFRKITPGANPDIEIHDTLTRAGSTHVGALYGWLQCPALTAEGERDDAVLQLGMLQQYLRTASDGWDLALASVRNLFVEADLHADEVGGDFAGEAARLGEALAEIHRSLAEHFPVERRAPADLRRLADSMNARLDHALEAVPELAPYAASLRRTFDAVTELELAGTDEEVVVQRIHGDLHLGQTLRTVRGWKVVDFEGEPAKPLAERSLPDSPWRDVAGMLRSFDYAPRVVERTWDDRGDEAVEQQRSYRAAEWAERNRAAFLTAYAQAHAGRDLTAGERVLLEAYVADKAVYETVYETRNRPAWVGIPLDAVARIGAS